MMNIIKIFAITLMLFACGKKDDNLSELNIITSNGSITYHVETAVTKEEMSKGLMDRKQLRKDSGMLFDINGATKIALWMKDTYIPLDMLFVNKQGEIIWIYKNAEPLSTTFIQPPMDEPIEAVLEINAGDVEKHKIEVGDKIKHDLIGK